MEYIRDSKKPIYVSKEVSRGLWLLSKAKEKTPDELADEMLRNALHREYPDLIQHQTEVSQLEKEVIKKLCNTP